jgi:DDE superfamily endonuclease
MTDEQCKQIALFRYGVISDLVNQISLAFGAQEKLLSYKSNCQWRTPYSDRTHISRGTIIHWIRLYRAGGAQIKALYPQKRNDINKSRVIDKTTADTLTWLTINADVDSVPNLLREMTRRESIHPGRSLSTATVYRFLHTNDLMVFLEKRKNSYKRAVVNSDENKLWMQKLLQGELCLSDLKTDLSYTTPSDVVENLYTCIKQRPLRYRKRAAGVLSLCKRISQQTITETLHIPRSTLRHTFKIYSEKGPDHIISDIRNCVHIYEDPKYIDKFFSILHAPPSTYGFNRTTWRQKDIRQVMADCNMPVSSHALKKIIDNSGYKYRKARTILTSNDPDYREKVREIKNILSNLKVNEKFVSIDEYGPFAIKMQGGKSLVPAGTTKTVPQWQKSKGSIIITAALELSTNQITHFYSENKNTAEMIKLLNLLLEKYSNQECIYFSWDAASWHASSELQRSVDEINSLEYRAKIERPIVKLAPLPTCAQFLNVIESVFSGMARAIIHNSDYKSIDECKSAIDRHFSERNEHFQKHPERAGNKIWREERVKPIFSESNNCKDPLYR